MMAKGLIFKQNSDNFKNFVHYPFWSMDRESWLEYVNSLEDKDKFILSYFPFFHPCRNRASKIAPAAG